jgi:Tol biopolymer transport system component
MGGGGMGQAFTVTQETNKLTTERTRSGQDGQPVKITTVYTLDGKESVNTTARGESKSIANWSADGKSLTIVTTSTFGDRTVTTTAVWTLDGAALTIKSTTPTQNGERTSKMVYDKK